MKIGYNRIKCEIESFDCGVNKINQMVSESYLEQISQHSQTYECVIDNVTVGYCMFYIKNFINNTFEDNIETFSGGVINFYSSIHIEYIAINEMYQHNKYGLLFLQGMLKIFEKYVKILPIRFITLDAFKELAGWYELAGFKCLRPEEKNKDTGSDTVLMYKDCITEENLKLISDYEDMFQGGI